MISKKRLLFIVIIIALLLLLPAVAMQFTNQVNWTVLDFFAMGVLLLSTAVACEFIWRKAPSRLLKFTICIIFLVLMLLIWAELAVGIF